MACADYMISLESVAKTGAVKLPVNCRYQPEDNDNVLI